MRRVLALKKDGYLIVEDMGKVKGAQLSNRIRVNWVQVIAETEPILAEKREKYKARGVVSKLPLGSGKSDTLVPNYLPKEKEIDTNISGTVPVPDSDTNSLPEETPEKDSAIKCKLVNTVLFW